jgi:hypothetical protein
MRSHSLALQLRSRTRASRFQIETITFSDDRASWLLPTIIFSSSHKLIRTRLAGLYLAVERGANGERRRPNGSRRLTASLGLLHLPPLSTNVSRLGRSFCPILDGAENNYAVFFHDTSLKSSPVTDEFHYVIQRIVAHAAKQ